MKFTELDVFVLLWQVIARFLTSCVILNCYHVKDAVSFVFIANRKIRTQWETNDEEYTLPARGVRRDWRERIERVYAAEADRVGRVLETDVLYSLPLFRMFASLVFSTLVAKCREYPIRWYLTHERSDTGLGVRYEGALLKKRERKKEEKGGTNLER